ncbi:MAG TPA: thioesterase family protein [Solirubrobacterales bacterium]|jgi:acyl-CoA thioester hydrolase|nr:acyl-CoA thioesterase [Solirubrobacterales bacterium]HMU25929.1 thioesterase family protein [Solirubrobacterales bacterium]HMW45263.1 thioesterase family protein [Solirubrobacterales bacterium]HMX70390.1 thioesterase family protein [Solirubrobacterales bacterium]HMY25280.1 thioesterase family protein [Solirubrobacterales bacterium]
MAAETTHRLRVRYNECDRVGIVFNSNYLVYTDVAVTEFWREHLGGYSEFNEIGLDMVLAEANLRFRQPLEFDDEFDIRVSVGGMTARSMTIEFEFTRSGEAIAEIEISYVCVSSTEHTPQPIPDSIRTVLEGDSAT